MTFIRTWYCFLMAGNYPVGVEKDHKSVLNINQQYGHIQLSISAKLVLSVLSSLQLARAASYGLDEQLLQKIVGFWRPLEPKKPTKSILILYNPVYSMSLEVENAALRCLNGVVPQRQSPKKEKLKIICKWTLR